MSIRITKYAMNSSLQRLTLITMTIVTSTAFSAAMPRAASFEIVNGETITAPQTLNDNETGTINAGGQLNTAAVAVTASGINNTVINDGSIATTGNINDGIDSRGDFATIFNSGSISTSGVNAYGIYTDGVSASITNSGSISTADDTSDGIIVFGDTSTVVNSGSISTLGADAYGIYTDGISASITNSGSISTAGNISDGIDSQGDFATIFNSGSISTSGFDAYGIYSDGISASITSSGSISTTGDSARGIDSQGDFATITNSGTISTIGDFADGVLASGDNTTIFNNGLITTAGASGIRTYGDNTAITNDGTISTTGNNVRIIQTYGDNTAITNNGTISTAGDFSLGIIAFGDTSTITNGGNIIITGDFGVGIASPGSNITITNSGSISTTGDNGVGIDAADTNITINNSGFISATGADSSAIEGNTDTTLNLLPGSRIIGRIDLGDNGGDLDTANIYGSFGSAVTTFANTEVINLHIDNAVTIGNTVVVVEPTGESARGATLNTMATGVHQVIGQRMQSTPAKEPVQVAALNLSPGMLHQEQQPVVWGQVFGSQGDRAEEDQMLAYDFNLYGVVFGYEQDFGKKRLGMLVGAAAGSTETAMTDTETDSFFLGVYGHILLGPVNLTASLIGGNEAHDTRRLVLDSLIGYETASSDTDSYFISPSLILGSSYDLTPNVALRPSATVTYSRGRYDDYDETGTTNANLQVDSRTVEVTATRLQLEAAHKLDAGEVSLRAGIQTRHTDSDTIEMHLAGSDFRFNAAGDENVEGGFIGCGTNLLLSHRLGLVVDAELGRMRGDETQVAGQITLQYQF